LRVIAWEGSGWAKAWRKGQPILPKYVFVFRKSKKKFSKKVVFSPFSGP